MKIFLLTHSRELDRKTNTGNIAIEHASAIVERIVWERKNPSQELLGVLNSSNAALLYPAENANETDIDTIENFVIIDSTWQEARKIYNQSPYLKSAHKISLIPSSPSTYTLRRNQPEGGLCTVECVIEILLLKGQKELAEKLAQALIDFHYNSH